MQYSSKNTFDISKQADVSQKVDILEFELLDSTNLEAKRYIDKNIFLNPILIQTNYQQQGRGRNGKQWQSYPENIMASLILDISKVSAVILPQISLLFAHSIFEVTNKIFGAENNKVEIKWPNDILIGGAKVSGILPELYKDYLIIGFGYNVTHAPKLDEKIQATSLAKLDIKVNKDYFLKQVMKNFFKSYLQFIENKNFREKVYITINDNLYLKNEVISISNASNYNINGVIKKLNFEGNLVLIGEDKKEILVNSGEILFS